MFWEVAIDLVNSQPLQKIPNLESRSTIPINNLGVCILTLVRLIANQLCYELVTTNIEQTNLYFTINLHLMNLVC